MRLLYLFLFLSGLCTGLIDPFEMDPPAWMAREPKGKKRNKFQLTLLSHATPDKLYLLPELVVRFDGPINIAVYCKSNRELQRTQDLMSSYPERVLFKYRVLVEEGEEYPVNTLRNLAIKAVTTSHFMMLDLDLLPSRELSSVFQGLSADMLANPNLALVTPAFELIQYVCMNGNTDCFEKYRDQLPSTTKQLNKCRLEERCAQFYGTNAPDTHSTTDYQKWTTATEPYTIPCFKNVRYEPYVILKKTPTTPLFEERFVGYGKNKIQHINHLRFAGYKFQVLPKAFVIHMPHMTSQSKRAWKTQHTGQRKAMNVLFRNFKRYLEKTYNVPRLQICEEGGGKSNTS